MPGFKCDFSTTYSAFGKYMLTCRVDVDSRADAQRMKTFQIDCLRGQRYERSGSGWTQLNKPGEIDPHDFDNRFAMDFVWRGPKWDPPRL